MAWLNAVPKPDERTKRAKSEEGPPKLTRVERMKRDGVTVPMPPNPLPHVIDRLIEIGLTEAAGMGAGPVSWQTMDAWANRTSVNIPPWEARLIRRLSVEYVAEQRRAESENCPPPWAWQTTEAEKQAANRELEMVLG